MGVRAAIAAWAAIGAPFETARARMVLGDAHHRSGNLDGARMEWRAAREAFEAFGALRWAERAEHLLAGAPPIPTPSPSTAASDGDIQMRRRHEDHLLRRTHRPDA